MRRRQLRAKEQWEEKILRVFFLPTPHGIMSPKIENNLTVQVFTLSSMFQVAIQQSGRIDCYSYHYLHMMYILVFMCILKCSPAIISLCIKKLLASFSEICFTTPT